VRRRTRHGGDGRVGELVKPAEAERREG
jgi:hypothetical protein